MARHHYPSKNLIGQQFGVWTVIAPAPPTMRRQAVWTCQSLDGEIRNYREWEILNNRLPQPRRPKSGSTIINYSGGRAYKTETAEYGSWRAMLRRCLDPTFRSYPRYGGKGISVCARWLSYKNFFSDMGPKPTPDHEIGRLDHALDYSPTNCEWTTKIENCREMHIRLGHKLKS